MHLCTLKPKPLNPKPFCVPVSQMRSNSVRSSWQSYAASEMTVGGSCFGSPASTTHSAPRTCTAWHQHWGPSCRKQSSVRLDGTMFLRAAHVACTVATQQRTPKIDGLINIERNFDFPIGMQGARLW